MKDIMKKIRLYIIAITTLLFVFSGSLLAQTSTIEGYVKDGSGRTAVPGINMYILNPAMTTTTDISGHYSFNGISSGTTITVSCYVMGPSLPGSIRTFVVAPGMNIVDFWLHAVSDADGNFYSAVDIGSQIWMGENLKTTRDKYGNPIPNITDNTIWHNLRSPGYCWYNNDATSYKDTYGAIHNGYAADTGNICPSGWHVPINADWLTLQASLGGWEIGGGNLKSTGTIEGGDGLWHNPNTGATNEFGFTALPGGERRHSDGSFLDLGYQAGFWVNYSGLGPDSLVNFAAHYNNGTTGWIWTFEYEGYSVRCLNDILKATLITTSPVSITVNSAQSGGNITLDGGASVTARGVCWSTSHNPTIADNLTSNGSGIGIFTSSLTELTPNTLYYVRAYATNSMGTAYGDEISFTTLSCPTITATISGTTSICQNAVSPNITFTGSGGTAPYTFTYLINSGTNLTVTTSVANSVTVAAPTGAAGTFTYYLLSAYESRGSSCSQAQSGSAVVTVNPVPFITAMTATVCSGAGFTVTPVNITNGIVPAGTTYSWPAPVVTGGMTGGAAGTAAANISGTLTNPTNTAQTATYTITPTSGGCTGATFTVTVTVNPQPTITGNLNVCLGSTTQLTGSGTAAASTPWVSATPGVATVSPTGLVTSVSAGTSVITYTNNNGCSITATVTVNPLPTATISGTASVCKDAASPYITFTGANGTAPYTFIYTINGGANQTVTTTSGNSVTIAAPTGTVGTFTYALVSVSDANTCSQAQSGSATITITPNNTLTRTSPVGTDAQTVCINTAITNITYSTTGATGATVTGLPAGVTGTLLANVVTIHGTPTASGPFTYTVTLTGGCGVITTTGTITVTANNTVNRTSPVGTDAQTVCINTAITNITYATTGATGATVTGLPAGVTGTWLANVVTISGTPTASGPFTYTITLTGGCGVITTTGTITVTANNTVSLTSAAGTNAQTKCINTAITNITYATTGATGATVTGLPAGVTGSWLANVVTISGTPTASGPFTYTVTLTGGCGVMTTTGTITVTANNTVSLTSAAGTNSQTKCINTAITNITYATTGATGATVTGLPAGVAGTWLSNVVTISGTPTAAGPFTYTVTLTGGCGVITTTGTITVAMTL